MATATINPYIVMDDRGRPIVDGTSIKVKQLVLNHLGSGATPAQLAEDANISLRQVHAAMLYYFEHEDEIHADIEQSLDAADRLREQAAEPELVHRWNRRLRANQC